MIEQSFPPGLKAIAYTRNASLKAGSFTQDPESRCITWKSISMDDSRGY
jgi:hypothetical protein